MAQPSGDRKLGLHNVPEFRRRINARQTLQGLKACRRGDIDLRQAPADDIDSGEREPPAPEFRADGFADIAVRSGEFGCLGGAADNEIGAHLARFRPAIDGAGRFAVACEVWQKAQLRRSPG